MLTRLSLRNFKRIGEAQIELGGHVVFVGPNNSGKTSALQALALWHTGLQQWVRQKADGATGRKRQGVTLNRKDLFALPVPHTNLLWKDLHTRTGGRNDEGKPTTESILVTVACEGVLGDEAWSIALDFDYANAESLYCRPSASQPLDEAQIQRMKHVADALKVAFLPPMSGLATEEPLLPGGYVNVLIGQGRTAEVLRNLCYSVAQSSPADWQHVVAHIGQLFGVKLESPEFDAARGQLSLAYRDASRASLDISAAGRGLQQTLLLLTYLYAYRGSTILLDEPDAHLEVLRQRQNYDLITELANRTGSQLIAATHSEEVLNRAAGRDTVIAFLGAPHRINDQGSQLKKSLLSIGFEHYLQAEARGWVLYLEGSTDAAILQRVAERLGHPVAPLLASAYVDYLDTNDPPEARHRFHGLREAVPNLQGLALFDRLRKGLPEDGVLQMLAWHKREIENYICTPEALLAYAAADGRPDLAAPEAGDLIDQAEAPQRAEAMQHAMVATEQALQQLGKPSPWGGDLKVSDEFLEPLFASYHQRLGLPEALMRKKRYHLLADFIPLTQIDAEVVAKLDAILAVARAAQPASTPD
ncbi:MAG: ATP-dependent nuclease [Betaproteobacteria bacterium]|jgi:energy-coupling factor transporter ATP-binding protein EcfA2|nr:AAA family ATPase [Rubrivivax sp.]